MSAPTSAPGEGGPAAGYYPDPSIPGYVRYWNGAAWVPGTSRPAPPGSEAAAAAAPPAGPADARPGTVEETGPVFFDEDPSAGVAYGPDAEGAPVPRQEPASAWQADTARQSGFGDDGNGVNWGAQGPEPQAGPAASPAAASELSAAPPTGLTGLPPAPPARSAQDGPSDAIPGARTPDVLPSRSVDEHGRHGAPAPAAPPVDSTVALRALAAARRAKEGEGDLKDTADAAAPVPDAPAAPTGRRDRGELAAPAARGALPSGRSPEGAEVPAAPTPWAQQVHEFAQGTTAGRGPSPATPGQNPAQNPGQNPAQNPASNPARNPGQNPAQRQVPGQTPAIPAQSQAPTAGQAPSPGSGQPPSGTASAASPAPFAPFGATSAPAGEEPPVVPWKPPREDPFQAAARAQASARPAGLGLRFVARLIDTVIVGGVVGAAVSPLVLRARTHIDDKIEAARQSGRLVTVYLLDGTTGVYLAIAVIALLVAGVLYEALPTAKWGRTLGKKVCGLTVRDIESFEWPGSRAALTRWLVYGVLGIVVIGIVNVLWCVFDRPWRQCWHDKAARTFVAGRTD